MALASIPTLLAARLQARILILTGVQDLELHRQAVRLGALGTRLKDKATEVLLQAIAKVQAGEVWLERTMIARCSGKSRAPSGPCC